MDGRGRSHGRNPQFSFRLITHLAGESAVLASEPGAFDELRAPLGSSYRCFATKQYALVPVGGAGGGTNATLELKNFQLQPFVDDSKTFRNGSLILGTTSDQFLSFRVFLTCFSLAEVVCQQDLLENRRRRHVDPTVTVAVGSTLGISNSSFGRRACKMSRNNERAFSFYCLFQFTQPWCPW